MATDTAFDIDDTETGVVRSVDELSPKRPEFRPQALIPPEEVIAYIAVSHPYKEVTLDKPDTVTGEVRSVVVPSPNCP
jgi:hypothetical protein